MGASHTSNWDFLVFLGTVHAYDVVLKMKPELTDRTSYVIASDGRIVMVHSELNWKDHVSKTLAAVQALKK